VNRKIFAIILASTFACNKPPVTTVTIQTATVQRRDIVVGAGLDRDALFEVAEPSVLPLRELAGARLNQLDQFARW
jgi:hypothetical protein